MLDLLAFSSMSSSPAEKPKPSCPPISVVTAIAMPVRTACATSSTGATNRNANSIGSVMPVTKEASAAESMMPPTAFRLPGRAARQMARAAAGRANIMIGKKPAMNSPAFGSPPK